MNRLITITIVLILLVLSPVVLAPTQVVMAQDADSTATDTAQTNSTEQATDEAESNQTVSRQERLDQLNTFYTQQIESYRQAERDYIIAKEQYHQLETLRLLEEAIQATRDVMIERNQVLLTYLDILYFTLDGATGINIEYKETALDRLESQIAELRTYGQSLENTNNREQLAERVTEFAALRPQTQSVAYRALSLISIGELQAVHDKSRIILDDLQEFAAETDRNALERAQFERATRETERNLTSINQQLRQVNDDYARRDGQINQSFYQNVLKSLNPVYVELSQVIDYLRELLTI